LFGEGQNLEVMGERFLNLYLKGKYKIICCAMYLGRQNVYLRTGFDG
jgi:hypothetical protein